VIKVKVEKLKKTLKTVGIVIFVLMFIVNLIITKGAIVDTLIRMSSLIILLPIFLFFVYQMGKTHYKRLEQEENE